MAQTDVKLYILYWKNKIFPSQKLYVLPQTLHKPFVH